MRIAIVGGGVSGLTAAYALHRRGHVVTLYERESTPGGHVATVEVDTPTGPLAVDTGFIVYNEPTYPRLVGLFDELGVVTQPSDMSFASSCAARATSSSGRAASAGSSPSARSLARPSHLRMFPDIARFYRDARAVLDAPEPTGLTLGDYLDGPSGSGRPSATTSSCRSRPPCGPPGRTDARLPGRLPAPVPRQPRAHRRRPRPAVADGHAAARRRYVDRLVAAPAGGCGPHRRRRVSAVTRDEAGAHVRTAAGRHDRHDAVVMATHADVSARRSSLDADPLERAALDGFDVQRRNEVVLHTDPAVMPRRRGAWSSWNVQQAACRPAGSRVTMTYHMNRLQALPGPTDWFVSVNPGDGVRDDRVVLARRFSHPRYTARSLAVAGRDRRGCRAIARRSTPVPISAGASTRMAVAPGFAVAELIGAATCGAGGMRSHLLEGTVRHRRARPTVYALEHDVYYLALDLDELDLVDGRLRLMARNRRGALEFRDADHWPEPATDLRATVHGFLRGLGEDPTGWRITLVTNPRTLGLRVQPGIVLPVPRRGRRAAARPRRGPQHAPRAPPVSARPSTPPAPDRADEPFVASMTKDFYVSPFIDIDGRYTVHVADRPTELRIAIALRQDDAPLLATSLVLDRRPLRDRTIARMLLRHPLVTLTTIGRIHWHAWRLWRRGIPFQRHGIATRQYAAHRDGPSPTTAEVTR